MIKIVPLLFLAAASALTFDVASAQPSAFYVSPTGKPGAAGTSADPFSSAIAARDAIRALPENQRISGVTVLFEDGFYSMPQGVAFESQDSGNEKAPIILTSKPGAHPVLVGGYLVSCDQLKPVEDTTLLDRLDPKAKSEIRQIDLAALGMSKIAPFPPVSDEVWRSLQVVHQGVTLPISRWPKGEYGFTTMKSVVESGDKTHSGTFVYRGDHPTRWAKALAENQLWLRGFWRVPWVINGVQVKEINAQDSTITLMKAVDRGIGSKYKIDAQGRRPGDGNEAWYALNLPEEITEQGEWAIDFKRQLLLIWPPAGIDATHPLVSSKNVVLKGLTFTGSLAPAIDIRDGAENMVAGCSVKNIGTTGILIRGGHHHRMISNDVSETGLSGIDVTGGKKATLEPGAHEILNNDISRAGNDYPVSALTVGLGCGATERLDTVGIRVAHNRIHDTVNNGVGFGGVDNVFEWNEVYRVGLNSGDLGGFYGTSGFTGFGNLIQNNFVHHSMNGNAFYTDDGYSGATVRSNVVCKTAMGVLMGGGHYNHFDYNIIIDCNTGIHLDSRGVDRKYTLTDRRLSADIALVHYNESPWNERHPELAALVAGGETTFPKNDTAIGNLMVNCTKSIELSGKPGNFDAVLQQNNVTTTSTADFVDPENFDFMLKPDATVTAAIPGFPAIHFEQIGLQPDEYRPVVPPRDMKLLREGDTKKRSFSSTTDIEASNKK